MIIARKEVLSREAAWVVGAQRAASNVRPGGTLAIPYNVLCSRPTKPAQRAPCPANLANPQRANDPGNRAAGVNRRVTPRVCVKT